jgi:superfamily II DNA or RNA helicase
MLGAGYESIGRRLTVGIIQKLVRMDLSEIADRFGCVVIDEIHHVSSAATWKEIVNQLPAKFRYGVTATLKREDGLEAVAHAIIGPTLHIIEREQVKAEGGVVTPSLKVIRTGIESEAWKKHEKLVERIKELNKERDPDKQIKIPFVPFGPVLSEVLNSVQRNDLIIDTLKRECMGHCSLVLSERVAHCEDLSAKLYQECPALTTAVIHGKLGKKARESILAAMNAGELDVLFAVDIAKEGLDIPRLDRLFLVAGGRNEAETEQKVGRIQRSFPSKRDAVIFDFVDEKIPVLQNQYYVRNRVYKRLGVVVRREARSA